jgi:FkbM family methyltransferase
MSTLLRISILRLARRVGIRRFRSKSGLGLPFICHVGDSLGENPFYNREAFSTELRLCAAWLKDCDSPTVYDVGANVGFWSTHLLQMVGSSRATIYSFEAVPQTFVKLVESIELLGLNGLIQPVAAAVLDFSGPVQLSYSAWNSLFAQVTPDRINARAGDRIVQVASVTLDQFSAKLGLSPALVKIDVEGSEGAVLRGGINLFSQINPPALLFEFNPLTLSEVGERSDSIKRVLSRYAIFYVDDFEGQRLPLGAPLREFTDITWPCNLFAVPPGEVFAERWASALAAVKTAR